MPRSSRGADYASYPDTQAYASHRPPTTRPAHTDRPQAAVLTKLRIGCAGVYRCRIDVAWAQAMETRGGLPVSRAAGEPVPVLVLDVDASIVVCHSEKESSAPTRKTADSARDVHLPLFLIHLLHRARTGWWR